MIVPILVDRFPSGPVYVVTGDTGGEASVAGNENWTARLCCTRQGAVAEIVIKSQVFRIQCGTAVKPVGGFTVIGPDLNAEATDAQ